MIVFSLLWCWHCGTGREGNTEWACLRDTNRESAISRFRLDFPQLDASGYCKTDQYNALIVCEDASGIFHHTYAEA